MRFNLSNHKQISFTQWDVGQYLVPIDAPPSAEYYIQYYGNVSSETLNHLLEQDGIILIPDEVFKEPGSITIVVRHINENEEHCEQVFKISVVPSAKPDDYIESETQFADYLDKLKDFIRENTVCVLG